MAFINQFLKVSNTPDEYLKRSVIWENQKYDFVLMDEFWIRFDLTEKFLAISITSVFQIDDNSEMVKKTLGGFKIPVEKLSAEFDADLEHIKNVFGQKLVSKNNQNYDAEWYLSILNEVQKKGKGKTTCIVEDGIFQYYLNTQTVDIDEALTALLSTLINFNKPKRK